LLKRRTCGSGYLSTTNRRVGRKGCASISQTWLRLPGKWPLPADLAVAKYIVPAGTATLREFSYIAPEIREYITDNCTDCVTQCPDTAILGKVLSESEFQTKLQTIEGETDRQMFEAQWSKIRKYYNAPKKKGMEGGWFGIIIDPSKCKGCAKCMTVCDGLALKMISKTEKMETVRKSHYFFKDFGPTDERNVTANLLTDMMRKEKTHVYVGGAGSFAGCGEGTALRMMYAATGARYGDQ
jgi:pyruvate ferredoxin oxidoreductase beta subunit